MFESVAKTNTTRTLWMLYVFLRMFESVAKTNTTRTNTTTFILGDLFESVAKTNTTRTVLLVVLLLVCLRVLLKQIQHAQTMLEGILR